MMIGNLEGFTIEPSNCNLTLFRRASEPRHAYEVEITSRRIAVHQFHPVDVESGDAIADAKRYVPALRKAARKFRRQTFTSRRHAVAPMRIRSGVGASALRDDIRTAFKELIEQSEASERAADQERKRAAEATLEFENEFRRVADDIIVPTLNAIGDMLQRSGWRCETAPLPSGMGVTFSIYRGAMKAAGETGRPRIAFACASERLRIEVASFSQSSGGGRQEYALDEVSNDFVADQVLLFFRRLTSEGPRVR